MAATTQFSTWDFHNQRVQQEVKGGQFVSAESTLIAAGPPTISDNKYSAASGNLDTNVYPVGMLESFGLQQNRQLQRIFEIGSSRSYFVPGRTIGSISLGRTFYYGPSLLKVLYAYYKSSANSFNIHTDVVDHLVDKDGHSIPNPAFALLPTTESLHKVVRNPGYDYFFIDLASDLFAQPTGMAVYFKDMNDTTVGAFYLEECYVQGHQLSVNSGSVLIMEGAQLQYDIITPIQMIV